MESLRWRMLALELEPGNLPPMHTLHLPNSGIFQDSPLWGKIGVTHTLGGPFVKTSHRGEDGEANKAGRVPLLNNLSRHPTMSESFTVKHVDWGMLLIQVEKSADVGSMSQLLTRTVMKRGQWVLYSDVLSGRRDLWVMGGIGKTWLLTEQRRCVSVQPALWPVHSAAFTKYVLTSYGLDPAWTLKEVQCTFDRTVASNYIFTVFF